MKKSLSPKTLCTNYFKIRLRKIDQKNKGMGTPNLFLKGNFTTDNNGPHQIILKFNPF